MGNPFADLLAQSLSDGGLQGHKGIAESDIEGGFQPISNLKPGDKVKWKSERLVNTKMPAVDEVVTVHRVGDFSAQKHGRPVGCEDFTVLFDDGSSKAAIDEFSLESRRFVRVE